MVSVISLYVVIMIVRLICLYVVVDSLLYSIEFFHKVILSLSLHVCIDLEHIV